MEQPNQEHDSPEHRRQSARGALHAYQERRRRRRAEDTFYGSPDAAGVVEDGVELPERERRRVELMEDARSDGIPQDLAELLYDIALEEGLDPTLGYELVRTGLGVSPPPGGVSNAPDQPVVDKYLPAWFFPAEPTDRMLRERMLRVSFRRLRSMLQEEDDLEAAFVRFASEPDVGYYGY